MSTTRPTTAESAAPGLTEPAEGTLLVRHGVTLVRRFSVPERGLHWSYAVLFLLLLLSGLGLYLPYGSNPVLDKRELVRSVHLDAALALVALPLLVRGVRPGMLARLWRDVEWFDAEDWRWLRRILLPARLRRHALPAQGRFNAGQKLNSVAVAAMTVGFIVTGAVMWQGERLPTSWSEAADTGHLLLMAASIPLIAGHVLLAVLVPSTRGSMRGILTGWVRLDFARRRHGRWLEDVGVPE